MAVLFDEPQVRVVRATPKKVGGLTKIFLTTRLAKNAHDAQIMMMILAILLFILTAFVTFETPGVGHQETVTPAQKAQLLQDLNARNPAP